MRRVKINDLIRHVNDNFLFVSDFGLVLTER